MPLLRPAVRVVVAAVAGVVLGSLLSGYGAAPANDPCLGLMEEGMTRFEQSLSWTPFGTSCAATFEDGRREAAVFRSSVPVWIAWLVLAAALAWLALRRPAHPAVPGALAATLVLALCGAASHDETEFMFTVWVGFVFGGPFVLGALHLWSARPRSLARTVVLAFGVFWAAFGIATFAWFFDGAVQHAGVLLGILAAAAVTAVAPRIASLRPARAPGTAPG